MLSLLLSNIRTIGYGLAIAAIFSSGAWVGSKMSESHHERALKTQSEALIAQCNADKKLTSEIGKEYETKISTLSNRVMQLKRMQSTKCVPVARTASGVNGGTATGLPDANGVNPDVLIDYASDAEKQRQQLISLQEFVTKVWKR
jgi:hypothetical protein